MLNLLSYKLLGSYLTINNKMLYSVSNCKPSIASLYYLYCSQHT